MNRRIYSALFSAHHEAESLGKRPRRFPGAIDVMRIAHARSLRDFDAA